jgi:hypothetical protein
MNEPLRPLSLAEILDRTAQLYRSRFLVFFGISTIPAGTIFVFAVGAFAFTAWMGSASRHGGSVATVVVWAFLILLAALVVPASLGASALVFLGESITIRSAYKNTWKHGWRYVGLYALQGLVIYGIPSVVFLIGIAAMVAAKVSGYAVNDNSPLFGGLVFLLFVILGSFAAWMLLRFCLAFPVCVVEQTTAWTALKRGVRLSHGTRGRILLLYILGIILNWMLTWVIALVVIITVALIPALQGQKHTEAVGMIVMFALYGAYFAVKAFIKPVYGIALTLFYFDQRIRKEGFDIEWLMQQAGMVQQSTPELQPSPAEIPSQPPVEDVLAVPIAIEAPQSVPQQSPGLPPAPEEGKA